MMHRGGNPRRSDALFGESLAGRAKNICATVTSLLVECYVRFVVLYVFLDTVEALASAFFVIIHFLKEILL